jgi:hypothetical protein
MATLNTGSGSIEVSSARIARQAERMFKLAAPRRAHRLEKAKAALAAGAGGKPKSKPKAGKGKPGQGQEVSPAARRAAAIVLSQGVDAL